MSQLYKKIMGWIAFGLSSKLVPRLLGYVASSTKTKSNSSFSDSEPWFFTMIPNIGSQKVVPGLLDQLLFVFGFERKKHKAERIVQSFVNKCFNKYMQHQIQRLKNYRNSGQSKAYWQLAFFLLSKSISFKLSALHHINRRGYGQGTAIEITEAFRDFNSCLNGENLIKSRRVYIPKADGSPRPLGVPTIGWRMYLHLLNNFLLLYLWPHLPTNQHGFIPNRGVISAWRDLLTKYIGEPNIYEFDIKKFFDKISHPAIQKMLEAYSVPQNVVEYIMYLCKSFPKLPKDVLMNESQNKKKEWYYGTPSAEPQRWDYSFSFLLKPKMFRGVPQGSPLSPLLAGLTLAFAFAKHDVKALLYADDGQIFESSLYKFNKALTGMGVKVNDAKSRWIKKDGVGLHHLKFLGMVYDPFKNLFLSSTRKGASLLFDKMDMIKATLDKGIGFQLVSQSNINRDYDGPTESVFNDQGYSNNGSLLFNSNLVGAIFSRMQSGSGELSQYPETIPHIAVKQSFESRIAHHNTLNSYNGSSICLKMLANMLRTEGQRIGNFNQQFFIATGHLLEKY